MRHLSDGERELLAEQEHDAREIGRGDDTPTEDEMDEMCEGYDDVESVWGEVFGEWLSTHTDDDTRHPF